MRSISDGVREIIKTQLALDDADIQPKARFIEDLGAHSLAVVELTLAFEEALDIEISEQEAEEIRTVQDAIDHVSALLSSGGRNL